jgi:NADH:ubiquinone oxidoreductase subunit 6 (subunit J)
LSTKKKSNQAKALAANIIAPGVGQLVQKRFLSGIIYLLSSICGVVWLVIAFIQFMINTWQAAMNGKTMEYHTKDILIPIIAIIILWVISYIDIFVFAPKNDTEVSDDQKS